MKLVYEAKFTAEPEGGFSVSFPDFPEAHTQGDSPDEAFHMAADCLAAAIAWRLEEGVKIPQPGSIRGGMLSIPISLELAPKVALVHLMERHKLSNVALAKKMQTSEVVIRRMLDPNVRSWSRQYSRALRVMHAAPVYEVVDVK